jgi:hypothetical protein
VLIATTLPTPSWPTRGQHCDFSYIRRQHPGSQAPNHEFHDRNHLAACSSAEHQKINGKMAATEDKLTGGTHDLCLLELLFLPSLPSAYGQLQKYRAEANTFPASKQMRLTVVE